MSKTQTGVLGARESGGRVRPQRADARRNMQALIAAARQAFAEKGGDASLDDIARRAGVGPGTLYRHFPTREALIEAVYRDGIDAIAESGNRLAATESPGDALADWLLEYTAYVAEKRGLAKSLVVTLDNRDEVFAYAHARVRGTAEALFERAKEASAIRPDVEITDVIHLANAIALGSESTPDGREQARRLLALALEGLRRRD